MLVKPENLRGAANICSDSGKRPLAAMFGADETLQGGGLAIYCLFYNAAKRIEGTVPGGRSAGISIADYAAAGCCLV